MQSGFTLIELMITLVVAGILVTIGVPSYLTVSQNARASELASGLTSAVALARAEAIRRGEPVSVCPSDDASTCSGSWTDGWIAIVPSDGEVLSIWGPPSGGVLTQTPDADTALDFGALGELISSDTLLVTSSSNCTGTRARSLAITAIGRVSVSRTACP